MVGLLLVRGYIANSSYRSLQGAGIRASWSTQPASEVQLLLCPFRRTSVNPPGWGMRDVEWEDLPASLQGKLYSVSIPSRRARGGQLRRAVRADLRSGVAASWRR
jgi:hypothetical protein